MAQALIEYGVWAVGHRIKTCGAHTGHSVADIAFCKDDETAAFLSLTAELLEALKTVADAYGFDPSIDSSIWQTVFAAIAKAESGQ